MLLSRLYAFGGAAVAVCAVLCMDPLLFLCALIPAFISMFQLPAWHACIAAFLAAAGSLRKCNYDMLITDKEYVEIAAGGVRAFTASLMVLALVMDCYWVLGKNDGEVRGEFVSRTVILPVCALLAAMPYVEKGRLQQVPANAARLLRTLGSMVAGLARWVVSVSRFFVLLFRGA